MVEKCFSQEDQGSIFEDKKKRILSQGVSREKR
jgi:hypothetical protein